MGKTVSAEIEEAFARVREALNQLSETLQITESKTLAEQAREQGRDFITISSGLAYHIQCTHCGGMSPGVWGKGSKAVHHKPDCSLMFAEGKDNG